MIRTDGLSKKYGSKAAVNDVSINVAAGSVYGLVGPNGAGKTTILGILAGLRKPTSGSFELGAPANRIAVLPDTPQFEPWLTAREVVQLGKQLTAPDSPADRIDEVLNDAGIADVAEQRVGGFSRGMLQRLGLAVTVVGDPEILLLDEPSSALDPSGRRDVLDLVGKLRGKATVMFSSHILGDVQEVCDAVGIVQDGTLLYEGSIEGLLVGKAGLTYEVRVRSGTESVVNALSGLSWVESVWSPNAGAVRVIVTDPAAGEAALVPTLATLDVPVISITPQTADLEDVFLELTT